MWQSIDLRVLAIRDPRVGWRNEGLRALLLPDQALNLTQGLPAHPELLALHELWPIDRLEDLIRMLDVGELSIGGETIHVKEYAGGDNQWRPLGSYWVPARDRAESRAKTGLDWRTVLLQAYDSSGFPPNWQRAREVLDSQLQVGEPPWNGVTDLRHGFLGQSADDAVRHDLKWVEVVAPIMVRFGTQNTVEGATLKLQAEAAPRVIGDDVVAGLFAMRGDQTLSKRRVAFRNRGRSFPKEGVIRRVAVPSEFSSIACVLTYRGLPSDRLQLLGTVSGTERVQWAVFGATVGSPGELLEALLSDAASGDRFEHAVATLFHLLGFVTSHPGQNTFGRGGDLPDIIAFAPERNWLLVIECTARDLDYGAVVAKLVTRSREIQSAVPEFDAMPVLVVRKPRDVVMATASSNAIRERVAILTSDEFNDFLQLAIANLPPDKVRDFLVGLIPSEPPFGRR